MGTIKENVLSESATLKLSSQFCFCTKTIYTIVIDSYIKIKRKNETNKKYSENADTSTSVTYDLEL